jgi:hypothetical protein
MCAEGRVTKGGVIVFFRGNNKQDCIKNNKCLINNFLEVSHKQLAGWILPQTSANAQN